MMMAPLKNRKHEFACRENAAGVSERQAYVNAGFNPKSNNAYRFFKKPEIQARIAELQEEFNRTALVRRDYYLEKLLSIIGADITRLYDVTAGGRLKLKDLAALPPELRAAVHEVSTTDKGRITARLHDKVRAIEVAAKLTGAFAPQEIDVNGKMPVQLQIIIAGLNVLPEEERERKLAAMAALCLPGDGRQSENEIARMVALTLHMGGVNAIDAAAAPPAPAGVEESPTLPRMEPAERARWVLMEAVDAAEALRGDGHAAQAFAGRLRQIADVLEQGASVQ